MAEEPGDDILYHQVRKLLGLNDYEARAFLALARLGRARAVTIAKESGIPTGRVYDVLRMLELKGLVARQGSEYVIVDPVKSLSRKAQEVMIRAHEQSREIQKLAHSLASIVPQAATEEVRVLYGVEKSISAATAALDTCRDPPYFTVYKAIEKLGEYWPALSLLIDRLQPGTRILVHSLPPDALDALDQLLEKGVEVARHPGVIMDMMVACDTVLIGVPSSSHGAVSILVVNRIFAEGLRRRLDELWVEAESP